MKKGFTLAEVLITLGIIGVVAALTIPTLNVSTKEESFKAKLNVCTSDLENAFTTMMATEGAADLNETTAFAEDKVIENLEKYLKIGKDSSDSNKCTMKNGAVISFSDAAEQTDLDGNTIKQEDMVRVVNIDINGAEKPNSQDIDQFRYALLETGLLERAKF